MYFLALFISNCCTVVEIWNSSSTHTYIKQKYSQVSTIDEWRKTNCRFPHQSGWKSNPYEFRNQALVLSFMELHDFPAIPAVVSNFSQLRTLKFIRVLLLVELKVFKTSTSLSRLSLSCSLVSNSRWRLAVFSTSDLRFCVMTVSSFKYWLEW